MKFVSHSQAGQDLFCQSIVGYKIKGTFVDVGACHPVELSNTFALEEEYLWSGVLVDSNADAIRQCSETRNSPAYVCDARTCDWRTVLKTLQPTWASFPVLDYASVDVDEHTTEALRNLLLGSAIRFAVITVEHDHYQRGGRLRKPNRDILLRHGYEIIAADVHHDGCNFEDWAVSPDLVNMEIAEQFRSNDLDWRDILKQGGIEL